MVVAVPKDVKVKQLAIVIPTDQPHTDGKPFCAGVGLARGPKLLLNEVLGVFAAEFFVHA
jgi:hypothetical protein